MSIVERCQTCGGTHFTLIASQDYVMALCVTCRSRIQFTPTQGESETLLIERTEISS